MATSDCRSGRTTTLRLEVLGKGAFCANILVVVMLVSYLFAHPGLLVGQV